jgi:hypothetical protein
MTRQVLARKIRDTAREQAERSQRIFRAEVTRLSPLQCSLLNADRVLDVEDDFDLTGTLRGWLVDHPLVLGDTLMLHREAGHYAAFDVLTETEA